MTMRPRLRQLALTAHVTSSVLTIWFVFASLAGPRSIPAIWEWSMPAIPVSAADTELPAAKESLVPGSGREHALTVRTAVAATRKDCGLKWMCMSPPSSAGGIPIRGFIGHKTRPSPIREFHAWSYFRESSHSFQRE